MREVWARRCLKTTSEAKTFCQGETACSVCLHQVSIPGGLLLSDVRLTWAEQTWAQTASPILTRGQNPALNLDIIGSLWMDSGECFCPSVCIGLEVNGQKHLHFPFKYIYLWATEWGGSRRAPLSALIKYKNWITNSLLPWSIELCKCSTFTEIQLKKKLPIHHFLLKCNYGFKPKAASATPALALACGYIRAVKCRKPSAVQRRTGQSLCGCTHCSHLSELP